MSAVEAARAAYLLDADVAKRITRHHPTHHFFWLWLDAESLALDCAVAMQFAEFKPDPRLTTPPKEARP